MVDGRVLCVRDLDLAPDHGVRGPLRRHDISGWGKAGWTILLIVLPYLGVFIYLIANGSDMAQRGAKEAREQQAQFDDYVRDVAGDGGPAAEIDRAKKLLDSGTINQAEFDAIKRKALATRLAESGGRCGPRRRQRFETRARRRARRPSAG